MAETAVLDWIYTPSTLPEEPVAFTVDQAQVSASAGRSEARMPIEIATGDSGIRHRIEDQLRARLHAVSVLEGMPMTLTYSGRAHIREDGSREVFIEMNVGVAVAAGLRADIIRRDAAGNVVEDTKAERLRAHRELGEILARHGHTDPVLHSILRSATQAMQEPTAELVRLYEVLEALQWRFGGRPNVAGKLSGVTLADLRLLAELANDRPLRQGRHIGGKVGHLRDAGHEELEAARRVARTLVVAYARYVDQHRGDKSYSPSG